MEKKRLRMGLTTGTCMAAGAKAALLTWQGEPPEKVMVKNPQGTELLMKIEETGLLPDGAWAKVIKDGGDDPDITHGAEIRIEVRPGGEGIRFVGGTGVGQVTKKGLQISVGEPAINPVPRRMTTRAIQDVLGLHSDVEVTVIVPQGEALAQKTLNPQLGILGGISILGTSGIVYPMSEEAFKDSLIPHLDVVKAAGYEQVVLVPGRIGEIAAEKAGFPKEMIVQMSNFVGFMLLQAAEKKFSKVLLFGHIGKLAKVAAGTFHTHNKVGDGRREVMAAFAAQAGADANLIEILLNSNTAEEAMEVLAEHHIVEPVMKKIAERASMKAENYVFGELEVGVILTTLTGEILGMNEVARKMGEEWQCNFD